MVRVVRCAVAEHLGVDTGAAGLRRLEVLQHEHAGTLAHDEAGAGGVERTRRAGRVLLLGGEPAHGAEPGEDQRVHAGLGAACEHRVRVAAADQLRRLADRVRAGRAGGDDGVVGPADAERDGELPARRVDEDVGQEVRRDAVRAALTEHRLLLHDPEEAADRRAEDDPDAGRVEAVQAGVGDRLLPGREREQDVAVDAARLFGRGDARRVEVLDLRGDPHGELRGVEGADEVDAALARDGGAPGRGRVVPDRGDGTEAGDGDATHAGIVAMRGRPAAGQARRRASASASSVNSSHLPSIQAAIRSSSRRFSRATSAVSSSPTRTATRSSSW